MGWNVTERAFREEKNAPIVAEDKETPTTSTNQTREDQANFFPEKETESTLLKQREYL